MATRSVALALLLSSAAPLPREGYPFDFVPHDAVRGHLMEGEFKEPGAVFFEPVADELFVADMKNGLIGIFDAGGVPLFTFGGRGVLAEPRDLFVSADGDIRVLDGDGTHVKVFDYRGNLVSRVRFVRPGSSAPLRISAFALDASGNWLVGDAEVPSVRCFDASGEELWSIPSDGRLGRFSVIGDIAVAPDGAFAVVDLKATPVQVFSREGRFLAGFGRREIGLENFTAPSAVAFDGRGFLYVSDLLRHDVKVFDREGRFQAIFGGWFGPETGGRAPGELLYPSGVAVDPEGLVYVSERFGHRVQLFELRPRGEPENPAPGSR